MICSLSATPIVLATFREGVTTASGRDPGVPAPGLECQKKGRATAGLGGGGVGPSIRPGISPVNLPAGMILTEGFSQVACGRCRFIVRVFWGQIGFVSFSEASTQPGVIVVYIVVSRLNE